MQHRPASNPIQKSLYWGDFKVGSVYVADLGSAMGAWEVRCINQGCWTHVECSIVKVAIITPNTEIEFTPNNEDISFSVSVI